MPDGTTYSGQMMKIFDTIGSNSQAKVIKHGYGK